MGSSAQAIEYERGRWAAVVFAHGRWVNGLFPPILCATRERAIALAKARAKQIYPRARISAHPRDGEHRLCGNHAILVASPYG